MKDSPIGTAVAVAAAALTGAAAASRDCKKKSPATRIITGTIFGLAAFAGVRGLALAVKG